MAIEQSNPLAKHFRQPGIYLNLPSAGKFYPAGALDMPESGQIPVYPMTVKDEIVLKTPDALMNGEGTVNTIQSCVPNIKNAWKVPACDLDSILISIRIASYGEELTLTSKCEHCNESNEHVIDLKVLLDSMSPPVFDELEVSHIVVKYKPQSYETINNTNLANFQTQSLLGTIMRSDLDDAEKTKRFNKLIPEITNLNVSVIADSIESITIKEDDTVVTSKKHITEFLNNCDKKLYDHLKAHVDQLAQHNKIKPFDVDCGECNKSYKTNLNFEFSDFFG